MSRLLYGDIGKIYYDDEGRAWRVKARSVWRTLPENGLFTQPNIAPHAPSLHPPSPALVVVVDFADVPVQQPTHNLVVPRPPVKHRALLGNGKWLVGSPNTLLFLSLAWNVS